MEGARKLRQRVIGSWTRVWATASILVLVWLVFVWLVASGRLEPRYLNVPLIHPYPPAGYVQNPFNAGDKGDLVNVRESSRVKADLLRDGQTELRALEVGDPSLVANAAIGRAREKIAALITQNNTAALSERELVKLDSILVGRLSDPNDASIDWMVEERGTGTITYLSKSTQAVVMTQSVSFTSRFWLTMVGDRYLIADALVRSDALAGQ